MSHPDPLQHPVADAARSDASPAPAERSIPGFPEHVTVTPHSPHSPIEREIERSERASAALAATRALARASFTDSQLAADDAAGNDNDIDTTGWIRTEYAALDHTVRNAQAEEQAAAPRNLIGGSFNPGIASQQGRAFPGASLAHEAIKTRTGAQARFRQEARQTPRGTTRAEQAAAGGQGGYVKPPVMPLLAPKAPARTRATAPVRARAAAHSGETFKFVLAAGFGAVIVLLGGAVAWKAGFLSRNGAANTQVITAQVAAQAEAARVLSAPAQEVAIAPAAGPTPVRSSAEVDAALAAAARAAAVPVASVHAAGPSRSVHAPAPAASLAAVAPPAAPALAAPAATVSPRATVKPKESVAEAIAHAQARADSFLSTGTVAPAPGAAEVKPEQ